MNITQRSLPNDDEKILLDTALLTVEETIGVGDRYY